MLKPGLKKPRQWPGQEGLEKDTAISEATLTIHETISSEDYMNHQAAALRSPAENHPHRPATCFVQVPISVIPFMHLLLYNTYTLSNGILE